MALLSNVQECKWPAPYKSPVFVLLLDSDFKGNVSRQKAGGGMCQPGAERQQSLDLTLQVSTVTSCLGDQLDLTEALKEEVK